MKQRRYICLLLAVAACGRIYRNTFHQQLDAAPVIGNPAVYGADRSVLNQAPIGNWATADFRMTSFSREAMCFVEEDPSAVGTRRAEVYALRTPEETDHSSPARGQATVDLLSTSQRVNDRLEPYTVYRYRLCFADPSYVTSETQYLVVHLMLDGGGISGPTDVKAFWKLAAPAASRRAPVATPAPAQARVQAPPQTPAASPAPAEPDAKPPWTDRCHVELETARVELEPLRDARFENDAQRVSLVAEGVRVEIVPSTADDAGKAWVSIGTAETRALGVRREVKRAAKLQATIETNAQTSQLAPRLRRAVDACL